MANQIKPSVTNPTIADIYQRVKQGKLTLAPDFQRRFVWTQEHQEEFIDTILQGLPFPEIYIYDSGYDYEKIITTESVIDGQQRLTTIINYIENRFEKSLKLVKKFHELTDKEKKDFLTYQLVVRSLGDIDESSIKEVFRRINLTKFKLEDVEIQNAIYDGKFIQLAKNLAKAINIQEFDVFYDSEFTRMVDVYFFLLILSTIERGGYFSRDAEIEKCIIEFNEDYPACEVREHQIINSFNIISNLDLETDSIWKRKSNFFTLIIELTRNHLLDSNDNAMIDRLRELLNTFESNILSNKKDLSNKYGEYYKYMSVGTNDRKARINRSIILNEEVLQKLIINKS